jgi:hypothetical protein
VVRPGDYDSEWAAMCAIAGRLGMSAETLAACLTQEEFARQAGTLRPALSAYEHGRKSPMLAAAEPWYSMAAWPRCRG